MSQAEQLLFAVALFATLAIGYLGAGWHRPDSGAPVVQKTTLPTTGESGTIFPELIPGER